MENAAMDPFFALLRLLRPLRGLPRGVGFLFQELDPSFLLVHRFALAGELRRPLGVTIVGGLIVSQLLTLYTTPVVYLYLDRFRLWVLRQRRRFSSRKLELEEAKP